jgi:hypothetical protein
MLCPECKAGVVLPPGGASAAAYVGLCGLSVGDGGVAGGRVAAERRCGLLVEWLLVGGIW